MNYEASVKIRCKIEVLNRDLKKLYDEFFKGNGLVDSDTIARMILSTEREIEVYQYINNLIYEKKDKHPRAHRQGEGI